MCVKKRFYFIMVLKTWFYYFMYSKKRFDSFMYFKTRFYASEDKIYVYMKRFYSGTSLQRPPKGPVEMVVVSEVVVIVKFSHL